MPFISIAWLFVGKWVRSALSGLAALGRWLMTLKPLQLACIALGAVILVQYVIHRADNRHTAKVEAHDAATAKAMAAALDATRIAAGNPKLAAPQMIAQITALGQSLIDANAALDRQSAAVKTLATETADARAKAAQALASARSGVDAARTASDRLRASSLASARTAKPCEPSDALKGAWR